MQEKIINKFMCCFYVLLLDSHVSAELKPSTKQKCWNSWMRRKAKNTAQICRELRHRSLVWLTVKTGPQIESGLESEKLEFTILQRQGFRADWFVTPLLLLGMGRWITAYINNSFDIRPALINCPGPSACWTHCSRWKMLLISFPAPLTTTISSKSLQEKEQFDGILPFLEEMRTIHIRERRSSMLSRITARTYR